MKGVSTIGNATLIAYDKDPIIATDPWFGDSDPAYFGSWVSSHIFPNNFFQDVLKSKYIWLSHGHPDHINPASMEKLIGKKILLPDHVGSRICKGLLSKNFEVEILPDRKWINLSENIKILCITTVIQDAILLLDVNGRLFINLNDAGTKHCTRYIRDIVKTYENSYLLVLSGFGDADMINCYSETGDFLIPPAKKNLKVGEQLGIQAASLGVNNVIPFSSLHQYQRSDSIWANDYITPLSSYRDSFPKNLNFIPAFSSVDCSTGEFEPINPKRNILDVKAPEVYGDNWSDELSKLDIEKIDSYFRRKERIKKIISFINFKVGGKDNFFKFNVSSKKGITFEVPRTSLMNSIKYEIFDDLLIGNFMKTTFHNMESLYEEDFVLFLTKYSDNGRAETETELNEYFKVYKERAGREFLYETFLDKSKNIFNRLVSTDRSSFIYRQAKKIFYFLK